jgi:hypothetical protein
MAPTPKPKTTYGKTTKGKTVGRPVTVLPLTEDQQNELESEDAPQTRPVPKIRRKAGKVKEGELKLNRMSRGHHTNVDL